MLTSGVLVPFDWRLLLQIDSDDDGGMIWATSGAPTTGCVVTISPLGAGTLPG